MLDGPALESMLAGTAPAGAPISGDAARDAARHELSKAVYHRDDPTAADRVWSWVLHKLAYLFGKSDATTPKHVIALVIVAALIGFVIYLVYRAGPLRRRRITRSSANSVNPVAAHDHRARALRYNETGDWGQALREWLRDCAAQVEARGILAPRPGRTAAELATAAGLMLPSAAAALHDAATAFDEIFFASRPPNAADAQLGQQASAAVRAARVQATAHAQPSFMVPS